ncbi:MAG: biotin/lipoyl-containing protein [Nitrososphaeraceae archaeon]
MQFKIGDIVTLLTGEITRTTGKGSLLIKIDGKEQILRILKFSTDEFEFILGNSFHHAKILSSSSSETKMLIDGEPLTIKKHSKLTEVLKKTMSSTGLGMGENNLTSQIPGRIVSIMAKPGSPIKKGEPVVVLESMKMQVAVKAHKDGTIKEIRVKEGVSVARYDLIAIIE